MKTRHKTWKALVCFLVLSLLCSAFTIAFMPAAVKAQAQTPPADEQPPSTAYSEGLDFYTIEDGTYGVMVSDFSIQYAIIPEEYEGIPVTEVFDYGFSYCTELEEVFIPKTVKRIGYDAFSGCEKLIWVDLSPSKK